MGWDALPPPQSRIQEEACIDPRITFLQLISLLICSSIDKAIRTIAIKHPPARQAAG